MNSRAIHFRCGFRHRIRLAKGVSTNILRACRPVKPCQTDLCGLRHYFGTGIPGAGPFFF